MLPKGKSIDTNSLIDNAILSFRNYGEEYAMLANISKNLANRNNANAKQYADALKITDKDKRESNIYTTLQTEESNDEFWGKRKQEMVIGASVIGCVSAGMFSVAPAVGAGATTIPHAVKYGFSAVAGGLRMIAEGKTVKETVKTVGANMVGFGELRQNEDSRLVNRQLSNNFAELVTISMGKFQEVFEKARNEISPEDAKNAQKLLEFDTTPLLKHIANAISMGATPEACMQQMYKTGADGEPSFIQKFINNSKLPQQSIYAFISTLEETAKTVHAMTPQQKLTMRALMLMDDGQYRKDFKELKELQVEKQKLIDIKASEQEIINATTKCYEKAAEVKNNMDLALEPLIEKIPLPGADEKFMDALLGITDGVAPHIVDAATSVKRKTNEFFNNANKGMASFSHFLSLSLEVASNTPYSSNNVSEMITAASAAQQAAGYTILSGVEPFIEATRTASVEIPQFIKDALNTQAKSLDNSEEIDSPNFSDAKKDIQARNIITNQAVSELSLLGDYSKRSKSINEVDLERALKLTMASSGSKENAIEAKQELVKDRKSTSSFQKLWRKTKLGWEVDDEEKNGVKRFGKKALTTLQSVVAIPSTLIKQPFSLWQNIDPKDPWGGIKKAGIVLGTLVCVAGAAVGTFFAWPAIVGGAAIAGSCVSGAYLGEKIYNRIKGSKDNIEERKKVAIVIGKERVRSANISMLEALEMDAVVAHKRATNPEQKQIAQIIIEKIREEKENLTPGNDEVKKNLKLIKTNNKEGLADSVSKANPKAQEMKDIIEGLKALHSLQGKNYYAVSAIEESYKKAQELSNNLVNEVNFPNKDDKAWYRKVEMQGQELNQALANNVSVLSAFSYNDKAVPGKAPEVSEPKRKPALLEERVDEAKQIPQARNHEQQFKPTSKEVFGKFTNGVIKRTAHRIPSGMIH